MAGILYFIGLILGTFLGRSLLLQDLEWEIRRNGFAKIRVAGTTFTLKPPGGITK